MNEITFNSTNANEDHYIKHYVGYIPGFVYLYSNIPGITWMPIKHDANEDIKNPSFVVTFITNGSVKIKIKENEESFEKGDFITIMKNSVFSVTQLSYDYQYFSLELDDTLIKELKDYLGISLNLFHLEKEEYVSFKLDNNTLEYLQGIFMTIIKWIKRTGHIYHKEIIKHLVSIFIINIISMTGKDKEDKVEDQKKLLSRQNVIFERFIRLLDDYCDRHREVQFYASQLGVTPKYLSAVTTSYYGKCASDTISDYVVGRIKKLMNEQVYTIRQICDMMNFNSQSFFGRYFKRLTGISPKAYMTRKSKHYK